MTELVTGLDLVHEQLWIAAGATARRGGAAAAADAADPAQHAIEVRRQRRGSGRSFAPGARPHQALAAAGGPGVRIDDWVEEGSRIGGDYDPLLAKLLVVDADRARAIARLARALDELEVTGIQTTLPFHRWLLADPAFLAGDLLDRLRRPPLAARSARDSRRRRGRGRTASAPDGRIAPQRARRRWRSGRRRPARIRTGTRTGAATPLVAGSGRVAGDRAP